MAKSGGKTNSTEIQKLIEWLRKNGVRHFKSADLELVIDPLDSEIDDKPVDNPAKVKKVGKDGLTREEQEEVYGAPLPDTEE